MFDNFTTETISTTEGPVRLRHGGSGPPLLLIHGCPETSIMWGPVADDLARNFSVYAPDLRGYGGSYMPVSTPDHEPYSKRAMGRNLIAMMRHFGHQRFMVAGHDRGARCGYRMALDHPEIVQKLVLMDIIPTAEAYRATDFRFATAYFHWFLLTKPAPFPEKLMAKDDDFYFLQGVRPCLRPEAIAEYEHYGQQPENIHGMCEDYRAGAGLDWEQDEADMVAGNRIAAPTLVLWGSQGFVATQDPMTVWARWTRNLQGQAINCGHFLVEEKPAETLAAMKMFLLAPASA